MTKGFLASGASSPPSHLASFLASAASVSSSAAAVEGGAFVHVQPIPLSLRETPHSDPSCKPIAKSPMRVPLSLLTGSPMLQPKGLASTPQRGIAPSPRNPGGKSVRVLEDQAATCELNEHEHSSHALPSPLQHEKKPGALTPKRRSARLSSTPLALQHPSIVTTAFSSLSDEVAVRSSPKVGVLIDFSEDDGVTMPAALGAAQCNSSELEVIAGSMGFEHSHNSMLSPVHLACGAGAVHSSDACKECNTLIQSPSPRSGLQPLHVSGPISGEMVLRSPAATSIMASVGHHESQVDETARFLPPRRSISQSPEPVKGGSSAVSRVVPIRSKQKPSSANKQDSSRTGLRMASLAAPSAHRISGEVCKTISEACELLDGVGEERQWERRVAAIRSLPRLLEEANVSAEKKVMAGHPSPLDAALKALGKPLAIQLADLRSTVVSTLCTTLVTLAASHGAALAPLVPMILPVLLRNHCVSKAPISKPSVEAAAALVSAAPSVEAMNVLLNTVSSPHHQTRRGVAELNGKLCASGLELNHSQGVALANATLALVTDGDTTVRTAAAISFWALRARFAAEADSILSKVQKPQQKLIERHKPSSAH